MITNGTSFYQQLEHSGKITQWIPGDDEQKYRKNLEEYPDRMAYNGWDGPRAEFVYRFNSAGFRAEEFTDEPSVMFLGCSMTMGVGIEEEKTWAYTVAKELGLRRHNLATGGSSNDACFRLFMHWHRVHKPKIVIHYSPPPHRMEIFDFRGHIMNILPNPGQNGRTIQFKGKSTDSLYETWLSNDTNSTMNMQKNKLAIEYVCEQQGIKYLFMEHDVKYTFDTKQGYERDAEEKGRDLIHPGAHWHRNMHKKVMSLL